MNMLKNYENKTRKRLLGGLIVVLAILIFTGNSGVGFMTKGIFKVVNMGMDKVGQVIDNHDYAEVPFDLFMTEDDKAILNEPDIPVLEAVDFEMFDISGIIDDAQGKLKEVEGEVTGNGTNYIKELTPDSILNALDDFEVKEFFNNIIEDIKNRSYTFASTINLTSVGVERLDNAHQTVVAGELVAVQDGMDFVIYPFELTLSEDGHFIEGTLKTVKESPIYTRPLTNDAVINEEMHADFLELWDDFATVFNQKEGTTLAEKEHLLSLVEEDITLQTLEQMYADSRGSLSNASITAFEIRDYDADAETIYTVSIPVDNKGTITTVKVVYSRPYNEIKSVSFK